MNNDEDELQRKLKQLQMSASMDNMKKKSMKKEIRKHAAKKRRRLKIKRTVAWFSTAAALVIFSIVLADMFAGNESSLPMKQHDESEHGESMGNRQKSPPAENDTHEDIDHFAIFEQGSETKTIRPEGMEEETEVTNLVLRPYGIQFQIPEDIKNYEVFEDYASFFSNGETTSVNISVRENADFEEVASDIQSDFSGDFTYTEEPSETSKDENPYDGIKQQFADPPQGYYVYQIGDNVLVIRYEYDVEAGDGMEQILKLLRESIHEQE